MLSRNGWLKMGEYTVYKHTAPNGKVYIGITCQDVRLRWNRGNGYRRNEHFWRAIQKYGWDNIRHEILYDGLTMDEACEREIALIAEYKSNNEKYGYNQDNGGFACGKISLATKRKMSEAHRGKDRSEEYRLHISEAKKGEKNPCFGRFGEKHHNSRAVIQKNGRGEVVNCFAAVSEAERELHLPNGAFKNISACARGKKKTAYGFWWEYRE